MEQEQDLKQMKVADLIETPLFKKCMSAQLADIRNRIAAASLNGPLKRNPVDRLKEKKVFNSSAMVSLYKMILAGTLDKYEYPCTLRDFIKETGDRAFAQAIHILKTGKK